MVHALQASIFGTLEASGTHVFGSSRHFVRNDQNKLCAHGKDRKRAELWVKINLFNVFVMYALDSAHVKVLRLKQSRSFAVRRLNRAAITTKETKRSKACFKRRATAVPNSNEIGSAVARR